jgi:hypothetical protein
VNIGALLARLSVFKAGFASAADPRHTVGPQRARLAAAGRLALRAAAPRDRAAEPGARAAHGDRARASAAAGGRLAPHAPCTAAARMG